MKKSKLSVFLVLVAIISLVAIAGASTSTPLAPVEEEQEYEGCTGGIVTGGAAGGQSFFFKTRDSSAWHEGVALVMPDEGYKYITVETSGHLRSFGYGGASLHSINEKGVGGATFAGTAIVDQRTPGVGISPSEIAKIALEQAGTAEEMVLAFGAALDKYGLVTNGGQLGCVDINEGWVIEYTPKTWALEGPIVDDYRVVCNQYQIRGMKQYDASIGAWSRIRRANRILESELYPAAPGRTWERTWNLELSFQFTRDNEQSSDWWGFRRPINYYRPEGQPGATVSGGVVVPDEEFPELLSALWWTLDNPRIAPYIPLYIGITELPEQIESGKTYEAKEVFNELRLLAHKYLELREPLVMAVWSDFEAKQFEEAEELEAEVRALARGGQIDEAQALLTAFLQLQVDEVMALAYQLVERFEAEDAWKPGDGKPPWSGVPWGPPWAGK